MYKTYKLIARFLYNHGIHCGDVMLLCLAQAPSELRTSLRVHLVQGGCAKRST